MLIDINAYIENNRCPRKAWRSVNCPILINDVDQNHYLKEYKEVKNAAFKLFGNSVSGLAFSDGKIVKELAYVITEQLIKQNIHSIITDACFIYDQWFSRMDVVEMTADGIIVYRISSGTKVKDEDFTILAVQCFILSQLGYQVKSGKLVFINRGYMRNGDLDLIQLFRIEDLSQRIFKEQPLIKTNLDNLKMTLEGQEPLVSLGSHCNRDYACEHKTTCFINVCDDSVLNLYSNYHLDDEIKAGVMTFREILNSQFSSKLTACQKRQIEHFYDDQGVYVNHPKLQEELSMMKFPIYFLDFETVSYAVPPWDNTQPYDQIPFQFSIHVIKDASMQYEHHELLISDGSDPRKKIAKELCRIIPRNGAVIAYNISFEQRVIGYLADVYPNLEIHLMSINKRMSDLMVIFKRGHVYHREMKNSFSIKSVLPALFPNAPFLSYKTLDGVSNGTEAMSTYKSLKGMNAATKTKKIHELLDYCSLDTFGLMMIYAKLHDITYQTDYLNQLHQ